jgi:hypothetical protein
MVFLNLALLFFFCFRRSFAGLFFFFLPHHPLSFSLRFCKDNTQPCFFLSVGTHWADAQTPVACGRTRRLWGDDDGGGMSPPKHT